MMKLVPQGSGKKFQAEESKMKTDMGCTEAMEI